jgi:hypothetical protein
VLGLGGEGVVRYRAPWEGFAVAASREASLALRRVARGCSLAVEVGFGEMVVQLAVVCLG